ncbi:helix-turn-helix transcriptional regulator [Mucilaginibacter sp. Bleaf8]|uniref:helix-turn-helix domain-containing protein n=1 Tax=Mucilaginibacter sp. Bleaf8 TaxID=2834430 RepID=UPI001BCBDDC7|nr:AraC family transcriptional regulator [Mucilaginibacter sp. Bleaf8]MBS7565606.1 helix-turn-helix transcriptional regulator [Mucilaginibacter sp. Bleaf8]
MAIIPAHLPKILYSCYHTFSRSGEQFVPEHILSFQIAGSLVVQDGTQEFKFQEGDIRFHQRNHLLKFNKQLPADGSEFKSLSVFFDQEMLRSFSKEYGYKSVKTHRNQAITTIAPMPLYQSFLQSLYPYDQIMQQGNEDLLILKVKEALLILLKTKPELKDILFDFAEPGKADLEAFMIKNFKFNVSLQRFAYLTGRSLATFKRDFEKIFHTAPSRWLQQQRLKEAYHLIKEKGRRPSDVYLEVGFEDLSHFSFAFKKAYGTNPSMV